MGINIIEEDFFETVDVDKFEQWWKRMKWGDYMKPADRNEVKQACLSAWDAGFHAGKKEKNKTRKLKRIEHGLF